jgi:peptide/nickel transport system substrate-binding protein
LNNKLVKQALSLAIDRPTIIKSLYKGQASEVSGMLLDGHPGFDPALPKMPYDPARAKDLLAQSGYKGEEIVFESSVNISNEQQIAEAIVQMFKQIGVNARQEVLEASVRAQKFRDKSFKGLWLSDWIDALIDPDGMMWRLLSPGALFDYWRDPEFDKLGDEARYSVDDKLRAANYKRMNQIILENYPCIPLYRPMELYGVANFVDFQPFGTVYMDFRADNLKVKA